MSGENVEIIRRFYEGIAKGGVPNWELFSADFDFDASRVMPDMPPGKGREAAEPLLRSYVEMFDDFEIHLEEVIASDDALVVAHVRDGGRIKGSGAEVWNHFFHVFTLDDGKIVRWSSHLDRESAIQVAGVPD